ncbi:hypothetical protein PEC301937_23550 [Pectobacterium carotovorum subsp. carotovorum]|nr:hypothetical protein PEC301937_23550 [Pectobacterium carotovorum subsp. carotovorum]
MIIRDYYYLSEAAEILKMEVADLRYLAYKGEVKLGDSFSELSKSWIFKSKVYIKSEDVFNEWMISSNANINGDRHIIGGSYLDVLDDKIISDDDGIYVLSYLKGYWHYDDKHIFKIYDARGDEEDLPLYFHPDLLDGEECNFIKAIPIYEDDVEYILSGNAEISGRQLLRLIKTYGKDKRSPQSVAQKERHAKPKVEILMAIIYLLRSDAEYLNYTATGLANVLFEKAALFWPEKKVPPLEHETIKKLLTDSFRLIG